MMGVEAPETCWATHKCQVINLWNCCFFKFKWINQPDAAIKNRFIACRLNKLWNNKFYYKAAYCWYFVRVSFWTHCGCDTRCDAWQQQDPKPPSSDNSLFYGDDIFLLHFVAACPRSDTNTNNYRGACTTFPFEKVNSYIFQFCF